MSNTTMVNAAATRKNVVAWQWMKNHRQAHCLPILTRTPKRGGGVTATTASIQTIKMTTAAASTTKRHISTTRSLIQYNQQKAATTGQKKTAFSSSVSAAASASVTDGVEQPTRTQLRRVFTKAAIPMIGFGFIDQTVMLQAGNAIDCTLGVTFGLSTLTAAAFGQICSDASGVLFGGTLDRLFLAAGLPTANLTTAQRGLPVVSRTKLAGSLVGVIFGCALGLLNLLFIDTNRSSTLKLQAFSEEQEFQFTVEASNSVRRSATALTVRGPDVEGLLASMTAALSVRGCSLVELHAKRKNSKLEHEDVDQLDPTDTTIEDVFYVVKRDTGEPFDDDELEELAKGLLDATRTPMNVNTVKAAMHELENTNSYLRQRIQTLEQVVYRQQITVVPSKTTLSPTSEATYDNEK